MSRAGSRGPPTPFGARPFPSRSNTANSNTPSSSYPASSLDNLYDDHSNAYPSTFDEDAPLTSNAAFNGSQTQLASYPPVDGNLAFLSQDPTAGSRRPHFDRSCSTTSAASDVEWRNRVATVKRGAGTMRRVALTRQGNFVADYLAPKAIINSQEKQYVDASARAGHPEEFSHLRYSAATCDPNFFTPANGWSLRQTTYGRETELLIACTSYNEDKKLLARTLHSVMGNVRDIVNSRGKFWRRGREEGVGGWERIVVCMVADGIDPCDKGTLDLLATLGIYQDNVMKREIDGKQTVAHVFEYTTQLSVDSSPALVVPEPGNKNNMVPVQMIFCLKQKNAKKLNSHRWLFNAFASQLKPEICILIDVGTKPSPRSLYELWSVFYNFKNVGGACGEIYCQLKSGRKLLNPLVAAQNFEYKMSNILDKPLESSFGYVAVLPGAFSAYRYRAVLGRPLNQYFLGDPTSPNSNGKGHDAMSLFGQNMYLAEDRILCFELVAKANAQWRLAFVATAKGETDTPEGVAELILQRRRWLNGSTMASVYSIVHFYRIYRTSHNVVRLFVLHVQALFNLFQLIFTWFALANLWLTFTITINLLPDSSRVFLFGTEEITHWVNLSLQWIYAATLALQFILALGNRPKGEVPLYIFSFCVFAFCAYYLLVCAVFLTIKAFSEISFVNADKIGAKILVLISGTNGVLLAALLSTYGIYVVMSFLYLDPWHLFHSFPAYIAIAPSFINILNVYAYCNLHDVSWGTKGSDKADALPSVSSKKDGGKAGVVEEVEKSAADLDSMFQATVKKALTKIKTVEVVEKPTQDDGNKTFRTRLVACWLISNGALIIAVQNANGLNTTPAEQLAKTSAYFNVVLWCTAGLALVRFLGSFWFWLVTCSTRCFRRS